MKRRRNPEVPPRRQKRRAKDATAPPRPPPAGDTKRAADERELPIAYVKDGVLMIEPAETIERIEAITRGEVIEEVPIDLGDLEGGAAREEPEQGERHSQPASRPPTRAPSRGDDDEHLEPRLMILLDRFFRGDAHQVNSALELYQGCYRSLGQYAEQVLEEAGVSGWLLPYVDSEGLGLDWSLSGAIWTLPEPLAEAGARRPRIHIFLGT